MTVQTRAFAIGLLLVGLGLSACKTKSAGTESNAGEAGASAVTFAPAASAHTGAALPPDPPPRIANRAAEAPGIEAALVADKGYQALWDDKHREDRALLFTAASQALATEARGSENVLIPESLAVVLERKKLETAFGKIISYLPRTGTLPPDFVKRVNADLARTASELGKGVWSKASAGTPEKDFSVLASFLHPTDPEYLREVIAAKSHGPLRWEIKGEPVRPHFAREMAALERLALITTLTPDEKARLAELKSSPLGDSTPEAISLAEMLKEYGSNEIRADDKFKSRVVEFSGTAGALERGAIGGITLAISTGKAFERPIALCFFEDSQTKRVKMLNRGDRVRVRGRVDGLLMNVVVKSCELVD